MTEQFTIHTTMHSSSILLPTQINLGEFISKLRENVPFLVFAAKQSHDKVNFLIDESVLSSKGANSTISYVHYLFHRHRLGETKSQMHADNCGAQNKNSAFLWYYLWRVMSGLHDSINYDFYCPDTKFAPNWCFGLVKQKTAGTSISSLFDIARTEEDSAAVNVAKLVGLQNGTVLIATYDWVAYLGQYLKKLPQLKSFYHFRFDKEHPGTEK